MISQGSYTSASSSATAPKILVLEIVPRLPQEQANTISKWNRIKLVFRVLVLKKLHQQGGNKHPQANTKLNHAI